MSRRSPDAADLRGTPVAGKRRCTVAHMVQDQSQGLQQQGQQQPDADMVQDPSPASLQQQGQQQPQQQLALQQQEPQPSAEQPQEPQQLPEPKQPQGQ